MKRIMVTVASLLAMASCGVDGDPRGDSGASSGAGASASSSELEDTDSPSSAGSSGSPSTRGPSDATSGPSSDPTAGVTDDTGTDASDTGTPPVSALRFDVILRQTVQACGSCGIWFDWEGQDVNKPRLEVTWSMGGGPSTISVYQHAIGPDGDVLGYFIDVGSPPGDPEHRHSILVKDSPPRTGLLSADLSSIPPEAIIEDATLWLHLDTSEGLANSDDQSVLEVRECPLEWNWNEADWMQAATNVPWDEPGGDFGPLIREIRAFEDMHALGYGKSNPDVPFDFTDHIAQLQARR